MARTRADVASKASAWSVQMRTSQSIAWSSWPSSRAGTCWKAAATRASGAAACTAAATDPAGRCTGSSSRPTLVRALPMEMTTLPARAPATAATVGSAAAHWVPTTIRVDLAAPSLVAGSRLRRRSGHRARSSSQTVAAFSSDREPTITS